MTRTETERKDGEKKENTFENERKRVTLKVSHHLLESCFPSQLADDHAGGVLPHVHLLDGHRLSQRVAPDAEDPSNSKVQP